VPDLALCNGKRLMGFEPTTFCMASRRSSQLSYSRASGEFYPRSGEASAAPERPAWGLAGGGGLARVREETRLQRDLHPGEGLRDRAAGLG
jgi:hypothetical protein